MKKHYFSLILAVVALIVNTQAQTWEKMQKESEGGLTEDIVVVKGKIFMSHYSELYRSDDNGTTWTHVLNNKGLAVGYGGAANSEFATDKKFIVSGDSIFFGNQFSADGGLNWQTWSIDASTLPTYYFHPTALNIKGKSLYLGTYIQGVLKSTDLGKTFAPMNNGYPYYYPGYYYETPRAIEFYNGKPVVANTKGIHYWNGNSWINCTGTGLVTTNINGYDGYLIDRLRFLGSLWLASTNYGVYYSKNMGTTWQRFDAIPPITGLKPWSMYSTPAVFYNLDVSQGIIFASYESDIYISNDTGTTWRHVRLPDEVQSKRIIASGSEYLITTSNGVYKSSDGGATWQESNHGFERRSYSVFSGNEEGYLVSSGGILKSSNHGKTLTPFNTGLSLNQVNIKAIGSEEIISSVVRFYSYGGTSQAWDYQHYRSSPDAPQWTKITDFPWEQIYSMEISSNGDYIATGTAPNASVLQGLYLSEDKGHSWSNIFNGVTHNGIREDLILGSMFDGDTIYAGVSFSGVYKSWDKGVTWTASGEGIPLPTDKASLSNPDVMWHILKFRKYKNHIYAVVTAWDGSVGYDLNMLYHSSDWGKHWLKINYNSLSPAIWESGLSTIEVTEEGILIANMVTDETYTSSNLIVSRDNGATWKYITPHFPDPYIGSFGVMGDYLYADGGKGLYRIPAPTRATMKIMAGSVEGKKNDEVIVPIKVNGFKEILSGQFTVTWNPAVASFVDVQNFGVSGLNESNFGITQATNGVLTFSWNDPTITPQSLPDSSTWFSIRFKLIGLYSDSTEIKISGSTLAIEVVDKNFESMPVKTVNGIVSINSLSIAGKVEYGNLTPMSGIQLLLTGSANAETISSSNGMFRFDIDPHLPDDHYIIAPANYMDSDPLTGIDVADIATLRRHLLQTEILTNPFAILAGDVSNNKTLSTQDIVLMEALILGEIDTWPDNTAWTFAPTNFDFTQSPFYHPNQIDVNLTSGSIDSTDFTGVKFGDVNLDYITSPSGGRQSAGEGVVFDIHEEGIESETDDEKIIVIPIRTQQFLDVAAFQFTLNWPKEKLEIIEISGSNANIKSGTKNIGNGIIKIIWDDPAGKWTSLNDRDELFLLRFRARSNGGYKDLNILESNGPLVYDKSLRAVQGVVKWTAGEKGGNVGVYPNPFDEKLFIRFYSDAQESCTLTFRDMTNEVVDHLTIDAKKGVNNITINATSLAAGVYVLEIIGNTVLTRQKIIRK